VAIKKEMKTSNTKSLDNNCHKLITEAPTTLRTPISLARCAAVNAAKPKMPRQEIKMAKMANTKASLPIRSSPPNFLAYSSSTNLYSNGEVASYFLNAVSILLNAVRVSVAGFNLMVVNSRAYFFVRGFHQHIFYYTNYFECGFWLLACF
jgi:hypothetical protein